MPHLPPAHHETSKDDSPNQTKVKEKQNKTLPDSNSKLAKSMTHHNQTKELTTWFLSCAKLCCVELLCGYVSRVFGTAMTQKYLPRWPLVGVTRKKLATYPKFNRMSIAGPLGGAVGSSGSGHLLS
jgi:hypothetical protein